MRRYFSKTLGQLCSEIGISLSCYYYRINKLGMTPEQALSFGAKENLQTKEVEDKYVYEDKFQEYFVKPRNLDNFVLPPVVPKKKEDDVDEKVFNNINGGYRIVILNHAKKGENKYNITATDGTYTGTNIKSEFIKQIYNVLDKM